MIDSVIWVLRAGDWISVYDLSINRWVKVRITHIDLGILTAVNEAGQEVTIALERTLPTA